MSERRYSNDPKEILERPIVDPTNSLRFTVYENYNVDCYIVGHRDLNPLKACPGYEGVAKEYVNLQPK